ncbi:MAG: hypothetical protein IJ071_01850 [Ruminococcus sp.]|nr:hypothetical protein [Ruminococcus sp.]
MKELRLSKKYMIISYLALWGAILIGWLFMLSCLYGNLHRAGLQDVKTDVYNIFRLTIPYAGCSVALGGLGVHSADVNAGWARYSVCLPSRPSEAAAAKVILTVIRIVMCIIACTVDQLVLGAMCGKSFPSGFFTSLISLTDVVMIIALAEAFFCLRARTAPELKKATAQNAAFGFILGLMILLAIMKRYTSAFREMAGDETEIQSMSDMIPAQLTGDLSALLNKTAPFALPVLILELVLLFFISEKQLKAREK